MAFFDIKNVTLKGISACVPQKAELVKDIYHWDGVEAYIEATGIKKHRVASSDVTTSDLCFHAAERLIADLGWKKSEIDALIFVTQTPDYILPATSCILQDRLGFSTSCFTLDISLGCSGWVYGLNILSSLLQSGSIRKGILLAGDTPSKLCSKDDKSSYPLFGDTGTATALEYDESASAMLFSMNSDGEGFEDIIVKDGGFRNGTSFDSFTSETLGEGIIHNRLQLDLNGMNVFSFGITKAPKSIKTLCSHFDIDIDTIDIFSFHQANMMMNEMIRNKLKIPASKVPYSLDEYGNTSSASIPLSLVSRERNRLQNCNLKHIACGFGVGLSWGSVAFETNKIVVPEIIEL